MNKYLILPFMLMLSACTYSINMVHTEGEANDVVDENQQASASARVPAFTPSVNIPKSLVIR